MNTEPLDSSQHAIILFAHGSRDPLWRLPIEAVADQIRHLSPGTQVMCAYLELTEPDLPVCVQIMSQRGISRISVLPMFLGIGKHARDDLPLLMSEIQAAYPQLQFELRKAIGEEPALTQAMAHIALQSPLFATHSKS
jgi:sirohydrochlorin cobaltochelatase